MTTPSCPPTVVSCSDVHPPMLAWWITALVVTACVVVMAADVVRARRGHRWLATMSGAIVFGWFVEWLNTHDVPLLSEGHIYCYPELPANVGGVPYWIPVGWGGIIYAATWTAQRLRISPWARPVAASYLALSIDFSLDPIARLFGFWKWHDYAISFFGIPYDNYVGWALIVFLYSLSAAFFLRVLKPRWEAPPGASPAEERRSAVYQWIVPLLCALGATVLLVGLKAILAHLASSSSCEDDGHQSAVYFLIATGLGAAATLILARKQVAEQGEVNLPVLVAPGVIHVTCFLLFLFGQPWTAQPALLAAIPLQLFAGIFLFAAPWRRAVE